MNHWREVFMEQLNAIVSSGFSGRLHIGFVGEEQEIGFMRRALAATNIAWDVTCHGPHLSVYEYPTLRMLWRACHDDDQLSVAYFHTKGVSKPGCWVSTMWRWAMNNAVLRNLNAPSMLTAAQPACGAFLRPRYPDPMWHFQGNFWLALASHIRQLPDPAKFAITEMRAVRTGWRCKRFPAEYWIGAVAPLSAARQIDVAHGIVWPQNHGVWSGSVAAQLEVTLPHLHL